MSAAASHRATDAGGDCKSRWKLRITKGQKQVRKHLLRLSALPSRVCVPAVPSPSSALCSRSTSDNSAYRNLMKSSHPFWCGPQSETSVNPICRQSSSGNRPPTLSLAPRLWALTWEILARMLHSAHCWLEFGCGTRALACASKRRRPDFAANRASRVPEVEGSQHAGAPHLPVLADVGSFSAPLWHLSKPISHSSGSAAQRRLKVPTAAPGTELRPDCHSLCRAGGSF